MNNKFRWFGNDIDGLSLTDAITVAFTVFYVIFKFTCLIVIFNCTNNTVIENLEQMYKSVDDILNMIYLYYFGKKTVDTAVSIYTSVNNTRKQSNQPTKNVSAPQKKKCEDILNITKKEEI